MSNAEPFVTTPKDRFLKLFQGSQQSHGVQTHREGGKVVHHTEEGPATAEDYEAHLCGARGLGLVPVREDGTCRFAAIDIDVDTINHRQLYDKVQKYQMPLQVCRSKSGGSHLYLFMEEPGVKAGRVLNTLRRWAGILGYPNAEIFPKQISVGKQNRGNWINLPYFGGEDSNRYAVGPEGAMAIMQFLESVTFWNGKDEVVADPTIKSPEPQMPPCLEKLKALGLVEGQRDQGLFNFGVFFRKSSPNGWEDKVVEHNHLHVQPPLTNGEVQKIIKSLGKTKYQYLCDQQPICDYCNRSACLKLEFGVGHLPWKEGGAYDELIVTHLRKFNTDPPVYLLEVNGRDVKLTPEEFFQYRKFVGRVEELLDMVLPRNMKQDRWDQIRRELHATQEEIQAPDDASEEGSILSDVMDFLGQFRNSTDAEDILKGIPIQKEDRIYFRVIDLQRFLKLHRHQFVANHELFAILRQAGFGHLPATKIKGKAMNLWHCPIEKLNNQQEDFTLPKFENTGEELEQP